MTGSQMTNEPRPRCLRLPDKHGVNPSISQCFFCGETKNEVVLVGRLPGDEQAPHQAVFDMEPCETCKGHMERGIILISVSEKLTKDRKNPYRTGGWVVLKEEALRRMIKAPEVLEDILKRRVAFVPDEVWDKIGLPRGGGDHA